MLAWGMWWGGLFVQAQVGDQLLELPVLLLEDPKPS
jgi:hypothetical protein